MITNTFVDLVGFERAANHLFKVRPDLIGKTDEVKIEPCKCSKCGKKSMFVWIYREKGSDVYSEELVDQYCGECRDKVLSNEITLEMNKKRKDVISCNWLHLPPELESAGFKNYLTYNKATKKALATSSEFTKRIIAGEKKNLLILGSTGTGKSHLSTAIARTLISKGFVVGFITAVDLFKKITDTFGIKGAEEKLFREMKSLDVLVIDDVGVEAVKVSDETSWKITKWTEIVQNRLNLINIWSSNLDETKIHKVIGERAVSRMYVNTEFVDLFCEDFRRRLTIENNS